MAVISSAVKGQTNVSGGIYANTTWTLANSPYIVTDTVVVFPGVTLTIQPGVLVKFADNQLLEIRQASLIALGSLIQSITFTSNSSTPSAGSWNQIFLNGGNMPSKFNYCTFLYANTAINFKNSVVNTTFPHDSIIIKNSNFNYNNTGANFNGYGNSFQNNGIGIIDSCIFKNNINYGMIIGVASAKVNNSNFSFNGTGLKGQGSTTNCIFNSNQTTGLQWGGPMTNCIINSNQTGLAGSYIKANNCFIKNNQTGINSGSVNHFKNCSIDSNSVIGIIANDDSIINCSIRYNGQGIQSDVSVIIGNNIEYNSGGNIFDNSYNANGFAVIEGNTIQYGSVGINNNLGHFTITNNIIKYNDIGINLSRPNAAISCNLICSNTTYDLKYGASASINASHNYWCTSDSASIEAKIYDGYDNINYGLVTIMPIDTANCNITTGIQINQPHTFSFSIFPNPAINNLTLELPENISKTEIKIYNMLGELEYAAEASKQKTDIDISAFAGGLHVVQISSGESISRKKFIKQ